MDTRHLRVTIVCGVLWVCACGSSGSTQSGSDGSTTGACPAGETFCSACQGTGYCAAGCPNIECLPPGTDAGNEGGSDGGGGGCSADASTACSDCGGHTFCVSGACPAVLCPPTDAGAGACPAAAPAMGQSCDQPQACAYGSSCVFCAPTNPGIGALQCTAAKPCTWGSRTLSPNPQACTSAPPTQGQSCGNSLTCDYCTPSGLIEARCMSIADTYTWFVGPVANMVSD